MFKNLKIEQTFFRKLNYNISTLQLQQLKPKYTFRILRLQNYNFNKTFLVIKLQNNIFFSECTLPAGVCKTTTTTTSLRRDPSTQLADTPTVSAESFFWRFTLSFSVSRSDLSFRLGNSSSFSILVTLSHGNNSINPFCNFSTYKWFLKLNLMR